jgi:type IV pilus assembly protein PilC
LKNSLIDVCDDIESGSTLSEAMSKSPKAFDRLYVNMIKAGEAGGALEVILRRLAEFQEKSLSLKRKVKGAMVYPIVVVLVAVGILTFIMYKIVPSFVKIFADFDAELPAMTVMLINISNWVVDYWFLIPAIPTSIWLFVKLVRKFKAGRKGWDLFTIKLPIFGQIIEKNIVARTTRTLGTLVASGVPILEGLAIVRETCTNAVFERMYQRVYESIREGDTIAQPLRESRMVDDMVVNMVDVGEETGDLDTMLYKVADVYDEEVDTMVEALLSLLETVGKPSASRCQTALFSDLVCTTGYTIEATRIAVRRLHVCAGCLIRARVSDLSSICGQRLGIWDQRQGLVPSDTVGTLATKPLAVCFSSNYSAA